MRHVSLTCKNHLDLRWSTKECAITNGKYNGSRNLFFKGKVDVNNIKFYPDMSGIDAQEPFVEECSCPSDCLIVAPEDKQLEEGYKQWLEG